jgi:ATP-dependent helicase/nuclease subunit B
VELIVGPARSGKAGRVIAAYLEALKRAGPGGCLMLVPTALRRRATESRLLAAQPSGVLVSPQVLEFHELADRLLTAAGRPVRRIGELARCQVIRQCLAGLARKDAQVLGASRQTPGLVDALDGLFRELKAAQVEPDALGLALAGPLRTPRNRVLALLYDAYQKALQAREVYDDAGQFWHAAALVKEERFGPFADLEILVVDGFQDLAPAQLDMLQALSGRARRTIITLTWQADRPNLFAVTGRTRERLLGRFAGRITETVVNSPNDLAPELERLRSHLFAMPEDAAPPAGPAISVIRAAGRTREVEEVARRIADLLHSGDRPGAVAVIARRLDAYAELVRSIFPRYGISFRVAAERPLAECPIVRAAMALARLQTEDYSFRSLAGLVLSNYFRPSAFGADADTARHAVRLAAEANVWEGRRNYIDGLDYLRSRALRQADVMDDSGEPALPADRQAARLADIDRSSAFLKRLFDDLALPTEGSRCALAQRLREVIRAAGLWDSTLGDPTPKGRVRDIKAITALEEVLEEVALLDGADLSRASGSSDSQAVTLQTFLEEVAQGLDRASVPAEEPQDAPVLVCDVLQSRALSFDHVFLLGVAEKEFPRRGRRHPFFDDGERQVLRKGGVDLPDTNLDASREMLLFYLAATRARRGLTLAYPSLDAQGRPALASHYLEELGALFAPGADGRALAPAEVGTRDLSLPLDRVRSDRELLAAAIYDLWGPGEARHADESLALLGAMLSRGPAAETALAGLAVEWEREHGEAFGPFDGRLASADIIEELCRRYPGHAAMSAGRLEMFGKCPFAFFASAVLGLEALEEPSPDLGPMDIGLIYHGLLERFFSAVAKELAGRLTTANQEAAMTLLDKTAASYFAGLEKYGRVGSPALWKVQSRNILRDVRRLADWHIEKLGEWRAAYTEVSFGGAGAPPSPPGRSDPITLSTPHGPVRIRGRIDRIDLADEGEPGCQVIDYKSGSAPSHKAMRAGTSFQLPIYLWAVEALLAPGERGGRSQAFFLPIRHPKYTALLASQDSKGKPNAKYPAAMDRAADYITRFVDAMRLGLYPVYPRDGCTGFCDFEGLCRYVEWRIERKWALHPIEQLEMIADEDESDEEADA